VPWRLRRVGESKVRSASWVRVLSDGKIFWDPRSQLLWDFPPPTIKAKQHLFVKKKTRRRKRTYTRETKSFLFSPFISIMETVLNFIGKRWVWNFWDLRSQLLWDFPPPTIKAKQHLFVKKRTRRRKRTYTRETKSFLFSPFISIMEIVLNFIGKRWVWKGGFICTITWPQPPIYVILGSFLRGGPKFCLQQSCSAMDLNKAVPPWRRKSWRKRYSNTMRL